MINFNDAQKVSMKPSVLPILLQAIKNPIVWAPIALAGSIILLWKTFSKGKNEIEVEETAKNPLRNVNVTDNRTVENGSEAVLTVQETASEPLTEPLNVNGSTANEPLEQTVNKPLTDEQIRKEMIRMTMSEMGKRSVEARRRKRKMQM